MKKPLPYETETASPVDTVDAEGTNKVPAGFAPTTKFEDPVSTRSSKVVGGVPTSMFEVIRNLKYTLEIQ